MNKRLKTIIQIAVLTASLLLLIYFFRDFDLDVLSLFTINTYAYLIFIRILLFLLYQFSHWFLLAAFGERVNFKKLILDINKDPMCIQKSKMEEALTSWIGGMDQTDDITVVGIRI